MSEDLDTVGAQVFAGLDPHSIAASIDVDLVIRLYPHFGQFFKQ
jgi:hypothetical protein